MNQLYTRVVDDLNLDDAVDGSVRRRLKNIDAVAVYAEKRVVDGLEALVIEVSTDAVATLGGTWPGTKGFEVIRQPMKLGSKKRTRVHLQLLEKRYREVFRSFGDDVCNVMTGDISDQVAMERFYGRLLKWQSFLQKYSEQLSPEAQVGLYGELLVLKDLLLANTPHLWAVTGWRGSESAHQDFQYANLAIEVKTTRQVDPEQVTISNLQQLDDGHLESLLLTVVHLHANEATGETLPEMVQSLRDLLGNGAREVFENRLEKAEYHEMHREHYMTTKYDLLDRTHYRVRDGFPRLTRQQVPQGVGRVQYQVHLGPCQDFKVTEDIVIASLRKSAK